MWIELIHKVYGGKKHVMSLVGCPYFLQICYKRMRRQILLIIYLGNYHEEQHNIYSSYLTPRCVGGSTPG